MFRFIKRLFFAEYECPATGKACPHPDLCGLLLRTDLLLRP